jgi:hypothetical protein
MKPSDRRKVPWSDLTSIGYVSSVTRFSLIQQGTMRASVALFRPVEAIPSKPRSMVL